MPLPPSRRPVVAMLAFAAMVAAVAGCNVLSSTEPHGFQPGLIIFGSDTAPITAPDTVDVNTPFTVKVSTFAGGCTREAQGTDLAVSDSVVAVQPYDRWRGSDCPSDQFNIDHTVSITLTKSGAYTLRILGRSLDIDNSSSLVNVDLPLYVR
ncbi:MAG TPA: hypothetical protein VJU87_03270 [Gemmatimonadaceae bacterium]|nr:hypothetical protein [Gemmatimonadaceae bacterium]